MTTFDIEIQLLAAVIAAACALPGVFLVLRRMAMMSDAVSHVLLLGIVVSFLLVHALGVPRNFHPALMLIGAALSGLVAVVAVEILQRSKLVREDAAIGLVFPVLFSIGVILVSAKVRNIHLDVDAVLLGELAFAPLRRFSFAGRDWGPQSFVLMLPVLCVNVAFVAIFYKELKLATFDAALAAALGFAPAALHYMLMTVVSFTAVAAFDAVGSVLVVALMIVPAAAAYLLTDRLSRMILWSVGIAIASAIAGYWLAKWVNANIAGAMTVTLGVVFALVLIVAPQRGLAAGIVRRFRQRREFLQTMLAIHLFNHEGTPEEADENRRTGLHEHLRWPPRQVDRVVDWAKNSGLVEPRGELLALTNAGRERARGMLGGR